MTETFELWLLAADKPFYKGACVSLSVPVLDGSREFLAHHSNLAAVLVPGVIRVRLPDGTCHTAAVSGGLVKVEANKILVLADSMERPEEIDENRARKAEAQAKEALLQKRSIREYRMAQANLARAVNRLRVKSTAQNR